VQAFRLLANQQGQARLFICSFIHSIHLSTDSRVVWRREITHSVAADGSAMAVERGAGQELWGMLQARLDCAPLLRRGRRHSARLQRSLTQLERRNWDLDALVGRSCQSLAQRAAQADAHTSLTGKWRYNPVPRAFPQWLRVARQGSEQFCADVEKRLCFRLPVAGCKWAPPFFVATAESELGVPACSSACRPGRTRSAATRWTMRARRSRCPGC